MTRGGFAFINHSMNLLRICLGAVIACGLAVAGAGAEEAKKAAGPKVKGEIVAVDANAKKLTVKTADQTIEFVLADTVRVMKADKAASSVADLKAGQKVSVRYEEAEGAKRAVRIQEQGAK